LEYRASPFRAMLEVFALSKHVEEYFVADWDPHTVSAPVNGAWGKRDDHKSTHSDLKAQNTNLFLILRHTRDSEGFHLATVIPASIKHSGRRVP
jgi:hypothetical protein